MTARLVRRGAYVAPGASLITLVPAQPVWVVANYREVALTRMRPGQDVLVHVDALPGLKLHGHVDSIGTRSQADSTVLAPDRAAGNFTKVTQRVPVKIDLDPYPQLGWAAAARPVRGDMGADRGQPGAVSLFGPLAPAPLPPPKGPDGKPQPGPPPITGTLALGLLGAVLGSFVSNLDTRLTAFSLADLRGGAGFGVDEASWVSVAYNVAEVAVVPMTPWLSSIISPRRAIASAVALLTVAGAFVPVAAPHYHVLVALRFLQGMGGGALIPLLLLSVLRFTPAHQRIYGLTVYGFVTTATPLFTESLAGWLTETWNWQSIFYISLPVGPLVALLVLVGMPVEKAQARGVRQRRITGGMALLALFAGSLTAALGVGQRLDWFDSPLVDSLFVAAALFLLAFLVLELSLEKPLIDLEPAEAVQLYRRAC